MLNSHLQDVTVEDIQIVTCLIRPSLNCLMLEFIAGAMYIFISLKPWVLVLQVSGWVVWLVVWVAGEIRYRTKLSLCWVNAWLSLAITQILDENQNHSWEKHRK